MWGFVPSSAAVLADWGAEVIKIEPPGGGDPMRGLLQSMGVQSPDGYNYYFEQFNRSKRGIAVNLATPDGHEVFLELVRRADVVVTSFLEPAREKLKITYDDLKEVNPRLVYARGHGQGQRGPQAYDAGFDATAYWARSGVGHMCTPKGAPYVGMPSGAFGDVQAGFALASGVVAALYRRSVTGKGGLVDVSLFNVGAWAMSATLLSSELLGIDPKNVPPAAPKNPLVGNYATSDDRYLALVMLESDRYWVGFCHALGREDLLADERYGSFAARSANCQSLFDTVTAELRSRPLAEWVDRLKTHKCVFAIAQAPLEVLEDPQAVANQYFPTDFTGRHPLVASPVQYNNGFVEVRRPAPEPGQHTEEVLQELGYDWDAIIRFKENGAIN